MVYVIFVMFALILTVNKLTSQYTIIWSIERSIDHEHFANDF